MENNYNLLGSILRRFIFSTVLTLFIAYISPITVLDNMLVGKQIGTLPPWQYVGYFFILISLIIFVPFFKKYPLQSKQIPKKINEDSLANFSNWSNNKKFSLFSVGITIISIILFIIFSQESWGVHFLFTYIRWDVCV